MPTTKFGASGVKPTDTEPLMVRCLFTTWFRPKFSAAAALRHFEVGNLSFEGVNLPLLLVDHTHQRVQTFFNRLPSERLRTRPLRQCG